MSLHFYRNMNHFYSFKRFFVDYSDEELGRKQNVDRNATIKKNINCQN